MTIKLQEAYIMAKRMGQRKNTMTYINQNSKCTGKEIILKIGSTEGQVKYKHDLIKNNTYLLKGNTKSKKGLFG